MDITFDLLAQFVPEPGKSSQKPIWKNYLDALVRSETLLREFGILENRKRVCYFLAEAAHETGGFKINRENMNYSEEGLIKTFQYYRQRPTLARKHAHQSELIANTVYDDANRDKRNRLGNIWPGDGYKYRGGGIFQTTGRYNFKTLGERIGVDLEANPDLIENPIISLKCALLEWQKHNLNRFSDTGKGTAISRAINRGNPHSPHEANGENDRARWFRKAWSIFGEEAAASQDDVLELGDKGSDVGTLQYQLQQLGYQVGVVDQQFGPTTELAVIDFQRHNNLPLTGKIDAAGREALRKAEPKPQAVSERAHDNLDDLAAKGSRTAAASQTLKNIGQTVTGVTAVGVAAEQTGLTDTVQQVSQYVGALNSAIEVIAKFGTFLLQHWWVGAIGLGIILWFYGRKIGLWRLEDHIKGKDIGGAAS